MNLRNGYVFCYADDAAVIFIGQSWEYFDIEKGVIKIEKYEIRQCFIQPCRGRMNEY